MVTLNFFGLPTRSIVAFVSAYSAHVHLPVGTPAGFNVVPRAYTDLEFWRQTIGEADESLFFDE